MPSWSELVTRVITVRYWIAIALIALFVTASYFVLRLAIEMEREGVRIVRLAAEQQVSSQRICFLAHALIDEDDDEERRYYRSALRRAISTMADRHAYLSLERSPENLPGDIRSILHDVYYQGQIPFNQEVDAFLLNARTVAAAEDGELTTNMPELLKLNHAGSRSIMHTHKMLYRLLKDAGSDAVEKIIWLGTSFWIATLLLLAAELFFIFRPMARRTRRSLNLMAAARRRAHGKATAADAAREGQASFIRSMSHELRTPLNAILGMSQLLQMSLSPQKHNEYAQDIRQAGEHLLGLINDILEFSRLEAGQITIVRKRTSLHEELEWTVSLLRPLAERKGLALNFSTDDGLAGEYQADGPRIRQVLVNLVGNAIKFTDEGSIMIRAVRAGAAGPETDMVRIEVEDTGIGVPAELHERIFGEFQQADASLARKYGGSGLGLAICSRLVHLMGGEIGVESAGDGGSLFWFTLRLERVQD